MRDGRHRWKSGPWPVVGGVAAALLLLAGTLVAVWPDEPGVELERIEAPRREWIDVALMRSPRPRRVKILQGECRTKEPDGRRGPFDVQLVRRERDALFVCPFVDDAENADRCERHDRVELSCRSAAVVVRKKRERRVGRTLWMEVRGNGIAVVARMDLERYVDDVVRTEHPRAPFEAQRAQAIVARTFALNARADPRHAEASLCDSTHCQVYRGRPPSAAGPSAAHSTGAMVLLDAEQHVAPTFFHSTCGGRTLDAETVWPGTGAAMIVGVEDEDEEGRDWCRGSRYHRWRHTVSDVALARALSKAVGRKLDAKTLRLKRIRGRTAWRVGDKSGVARVSGAKMHRVLGRRIGWDHVLSPRFVARRRGRKFRLSGWGLGHGVGLCQTGAAARAEAGQTAEKILEAYFPKLEIGSLPR